MLFKSTTDAFLSFNCNNHIGFFPQRRADTFVVSKYWIVVANHFLYGYFRTVVIGIADHKPL